MIQTKGKLNSKLHIDTRFYLHHFDGFIYLQPQQEYRLTIRGAFPVFSYEQCNARLVGGDLGIVYEPLYQLKLRSDWSYTRGTNTTDELPLNLIPPLNSRQSATYEMAQWKSWRNVKIEVEHRYTSKQWYWNESLDFIPPPQGFHFWEVHLGGRLDLFSRPPQFRIGIENLLNTTYRDYLNRQRYFADAIGRNFTLSWIQNF